MNKKTSTNDLVLSSNKRLKISNLSVFRPKKILNLLPYNFKLFSFNVGFKKKNKDLLIIIFDNIVNVHCVYSLTSTPSAPIIWDRKYNKGKCKALIVNSGNANAHTGANGLKIINQYVSELARKIKCKKEEILVSSTGVIGEIFNPDLIIKSINKINKMKSTDLVSAAEAIMTTDTFPKTYIKKVNIENKSIKIYGFAKGSGMIQPNMGTMLVYIFIEGLINKFQLKKLINNNIEDSFHSISVDSDTSTSDTLMLFSISNRKINLKNNKIFNSISKGLFEVMYNLAYQVIIDGEGVSKIIIVNVKKAKTSIQAKNIAFSIINSPLVKTAIAGEDANWGRIIMAIGKTYERINQDLIKIKFGNITVCSKGRIQRRIDNRNLNRYMKNQIIKISVDLGLGSESKTVIGNDLTYKYIKINAEYRS